MPLPMESAARSCEQHHADWPSVTQHLVDDFPEVALVDVVREVRRAKDAVDVSGLDEDALAIGEVIARQQLMLLAGRRTDAARLDPQSHVRPSPQVA